MRVERVLTRGATWRYQHPATRVFIFSPAPLLRPTQKLALATDSTHRAAPQPRTATHRAPRCCSVRPVFAQCAHHRVHPFPLRKSLARLTCPTQQRRRTTAVSPQSYVCPDPPPSMLSLQHHRHPRCHGSRLRTWYTRRERRKRSLHLVSLHFVSMSLWRDVSAVYSKI